MDFDGDVLALDLATRFGWCEGKPGGTPRHGSERFAPEGSDPEVVFGGAIQWLGTRLKAFRPRAIIFEAPFAASVMQGKTNVKTTRILMGLPAVIGGVANRYGYRSVQHYHSAKGLWEAKVNDVREHFIGKRNLKSAEAKRTVIDRCRMLGYEPKDDNAADAIALWDYFCAKVAPPLALRSTPLFASTSCLARQFGDSMACLTCNQAWDVGDQNPPACKRRAA